MQAALLCNSSTIIICHNNASGNLKPSTEDIKMTNKIKEAGNVLDLKLLDHIILTSESYYSFADEGHL
ncbi:JAB domain-containing protein [Chryseobacterium sp. KCF3-3]|uniref:JAB domain-containing protein n=1 Tax=Chryseobacterium sp. KCF3-3 TaxID=3231511 RepID=UPI0038B3E794